ncbi:hypothetical protein ACEPAG_2387 [Sanghuangporus baumii]
MESYRRDGQPRHRGDDMYRSRPEETEPQFVRSRYSGRLIPVVDGKPQWDAPLAEVHRGHSSSERERLAERFSEHRTRPQPLPPLIPPMYNNAPPPPRIYPVYRAPPPFAGFAPAPAAAPAAPTAPASGVHRPFTNTDTSAFPTHSRPQYMSTGQISSHRRGSTDRETYDDYRDRYEYEAKSGDEPPRHGASRHTSSWEANLPTRDSGHDSRRAGTWYDVDPDRAHSPEPISRRDRSPPPKYTESSSAQYRQQSGDYSDPRDEYMRSARAKPQGHGAHDRPDSPILVGRGSMFKKDEEERAKRQEQEKRTSSSTRHHHRSRDYSDSKDDHLRSARAKHQGHGARDRHGSPDIIGRGSLYEKDEEERKQRAKWQEPIVIPKHGDEGSDDSDIYYKAGKAQAKSSRDTYAEDRRTRGVSGGFSSHSKKAAPPPRAEKEKTSRSTPKEKTSTRSSTRPKTRTEPRYSESSRKDSIPTGGSGSRTTYHEIPQTSNSNWQVEWEIESIHSSDSDAKPPGWTSKSSPKEIIKRCKREAQEAVDICDKNKYGWVKSIWEKKRDAFDSIDTKGVNFKADVKKMRDTFLGEYKNRLLGEKKKWREKGDDSEVGYINRLIKKVQDWEKEDVTK